MLDPKTRLLFTAINASNYDEIEHLIEDEPSLVKAKNPDLVNFVFGDMNSLIGSSTSNMNPLQVALVALENEIDSNDSDVTDYILGEKRKIIDFLIRKSEKGAFSKEYWGQNNTTFHLVSFFGEADFLSMMLKIDDEYLKKNDLGYTAVDVACDDDIVTVFRKVDSKKSLNQVKRPSARPNSPSKSIFATPKVDVKPVVVDLKVENSSTTNLEGLKSIDIPLISSIEKSTVSDKPDVSKTHALQPPLSTTKEEIITTILPKSQPQISLPFTDIKKPATSNRVSANRFVVGDRPLAGLVPTNKSVKNSSFFTKLTESLDISPNSPQSSTISNISSVSKLKAEFMNETQQQQKFLNKSYNSMTDFKSSMPLMTGNILKTSFSDSCFSVTETSKAKARADVRSIWNQKVDTPVIEKSKPEKIVISEIKSNRDVAKTTLKETQIVEPKLEKEKIPKVDIKKDISIKTESQHLLRPIPTLQNRTTSYKPELDTASQLIKKFEQSSLNGNPPSLGRNFVTKSIIANPDMVVAKEQKSENIDRIKSQIEIIKIVENMVVDEKFAKKNTLEDLKKKDSAFSTTSQTSLFFDSKEDFKSDKTVSKNPIKAIEKSMSTVDEIKTISNHSNILDIQVNPVIKDKESSNSTVDLKNDCIIVNEKNLQRLDIAKNDLKINTPASLITIDTPSVIITQTPSNEETTKPTVYESTHSRLDYSLQVKPNIIRSISDITLTDFDNENSTTTEYYDIGDIDNQNADNDTPDESEIDIFNSISSSQDIFDKFLGLNLEMPKMESLFDDGESWFSDILSPTKNSSFEQTETKKELVSPKKVISDVFIPDKNPELKSLNFLPTKLEAVLESHEESDANISNELKFKAQQNKKKPTRKGVSFLKCWDPKFEEKKYIAKDSTVTIKNVGSTSEHLVLHFDRLHYYLNSPIEKDQIVDIVVRCGNQEIACEGIQILHTTRQVLINFDCVFDYNSNTKITIDVFSRDIDFSSQSNAMATQPSKSKRTKFLKSTKKMLIGSFQNSKKKQTDGPILSEESLLMSDSDDDGPLEITGTPQFKVTTSFKPNEEFKNSTYNFEVEFNLKDSQLPIGKITMKSVCIPHSPNIEKYLLPSSVNECEHAFDRLAGLNRVWMKGPLYLNKILYTFELKGRILTACELDSNDIALRFDLSILDFVTGTGVELYLKNFEDLEHCKIILNQLLEDLKLKPATPPTKKKLDFDPNIFLSPDEFVFEFKDSERLRFRADSKLKCVYWLLAICKLWIYTAKDDIPEWLTILN